MTKYVEVAVGDLFEAKSGQPKYVREYVEGHEGEFPVYSASLLKPFGLIDSFDYDGKFLTWIMNGYGGRVQIVDGQFSATRDRGVLLPIDADRAPDLTYFKYVVEPQLKAAAVGRRVDGRANEYTKIYPETVMQVAVQIPMLATGGVDFPLMREVGRRLRKIESSQRAVEVSRDALFNASVALRTPEPFVELGLGSSNVFSLEIGNRVLRSELVESGGVPVFSANALKPFGRVLQSNLTDFSNHSLLWGIDGNFDWNLIEPEVEFATTDHCGRLQLLDDQLDPQYVWAYLKHTRLRYGFDRVFRASLSNVRAEAVVRIPVAADGTPDLGRQQRTAREFKLRERSRERAIAAIGEVLRAQLAPFSRL